MSPRDGDASFVYPLTASSAPPRGTEMVLEGGGDGEELLLQPLLVRALFAVGEVSNQSLDRRHWAGTAEKPWLESRIQPVAIKPISVRVSKSQCQSLRPTGHTEELCLIVSGLTQIGTCNLNGAGSGGWCLNPDIMNSPSRSATCIDVQLCFSVGSVP